MITELFEGLRSKLQRRSHEMAVVKSTTVHELAVRVADGHEPSVAELEEFGIVLDTPKICPECGSKHTRRTRDVRRGDALQTGLICDSCGHEWETAKQADVPAGQIGLAEFQAMVQAVVERRSLRQTLEDEPKHRQTLVELQAQRKAAELRLKDAQVAYDCIHRETGDGMARAEAGIAAAERASSQLVEGCIVPELVFQYRQIKAELGHAIKTSEELYSELWGYGGPGLESVVQNSVGSKLLAHLQECSHFGALFEQVREDEPAMFRRDVLDDPDCVKRFGYWLDPSSTLFRNHLIVDRKRNAELERARERYSRFWKSELEPTLRRWTESTAKAKTLQSDLEALRATMANS